MAYAKFNIGEKVYETKEGRDFEITGIEITRSKTLYKGHVQGSIQRQTFEEKDLTRERFTVQVYDNVNKEYIINASCETMNISREQISTFGSYPTTKTELSFEDLNEVERQLKALSDIDSVTF